MNFTEWYLSNNEQPSYKEAFEAGVKHGREYLAAPEQSEPTHYVDDHGLLYTAARVKFLGIAMDLMQPLYSHPQPTELTDEEIKDLWSEAHDDTSPQMPYQTFARAVLAAQKGKA